MFRTVAVVLALALGTVGLPFATQEQVTEGQGVSQIQPEFTVGQQVEKTGVQTSEVETQDQPVVALTSGNPEQYTEVNTVQQVTGEKSTVQTQPNAQVNQQNFALPKRENVPVNSQRPQQSHIENPVQPLSVIPVNPPSQVPQPVVVSAESIPFEGKIIVAVESTQQKKFQAENVTPESQINYQQVVQPQGEKTNQQPYYVQPPQLGQTFTTAVVQPSPSAVVREQTEVQQPVVQIPNYDQIPVPQEVYSVQQNPQAFVPQTSENQVPYQAAAAFVPVNTLPVQQERCVQQSTEGVVQPHQSSYTPTQNQNYALKPVVAENINKVSQQQSNRVKIQQQYSNQQNQPSEQSSFNVQPVVVEQTEKQGQYQQVYSPAQTQPQQETQTVQQVVEKHVPYQQTYSGESVDQPQVYSVHPGTVQIENQPGYQQVTQSQFVVGQNA